MGFVESFFKGGDGLLRMFCFTERNRQVEGKLRDIVKTLPRFHENLDRAFALLERPNEQLRQSQIGVRPPRIDQQALLIVRGGFGEFCLGWSRLICARECAGAFIEKLCQQIVGLIFFRMLPDDFLQHLDCFRHAGLSGQTRKRVFPAHSSPPVVTPEL